MKSKKAGYSLIELLVSMAIFAVLIVVFTQVLFSAVRISYDNYQRSLLRESITETFDYIKRDIRNASRIDNCGPVVNDDRNIDPTKCEIIIDDTLTISWELCPYPGVTSTQYKYAVCKFETRSGVKTLVKRTPNFVYVRKIDFEQLIIENTEEKFTNNTIIITMEMGPKDQIEADGPEENFEVQQIIVSTRNAI